jgi:lipid-binding SYLF domain-containing protein
MRRISALMGLATMVAWITVLPASARGWGSDRSRHELMEAEETVASFRAQPELRPYFREAYGYAVFPTVGKAALFLGGAYGTGKVYERGSLIGNARISKASFGFQIGGEAYSEIIFFRSARVLEKFKRGELTLHAEASATAPTVGTNVEAAWERGVAVFARSKGGLMASAAVGGQSFEFEPVSRRD